MLDYEIEEYLNGRMITITNAANPNDTHVLWFGNGMIYDNTTNKSYIYYL